MSRIVRIASWSGTPRASVVFVHGLGGHVYGTWRCAADDDTFWPLWLARDVEGLAVYSLAYEAPASNWLGTSMPLQDRAVNIFEVLLTEPGLRTGPVIFVCHSLGGLIVKKILLNLQQQAMRRPEAADFLQRVTKVVFAATPHTGSAQATWLDRLRFLAWPSSIARILVANDPSLRDINVAYRGLADERRSILRHQIFYETRDTPAGGIVDEASADPGLPGDPPVPIDADHISIAKPQDRSSLLYARVRQFVELDPAVAGGSEIEVFPLPVIRSDQPLNIVPKLIRIAALCLAALIAFKGVQALVAPPADVQTIQGPLVDQLATKDRQMAEKDEQIAKLIDALNEKRTTPVPPGADQELKKAVVAIDEGAKVDSRYAQALELLKAGKPSEAEPLLKAVAEEKMKGADNATKVAAAAYRNLASIAAVSDPGRAREYYAKAAELDPDNIDGMLWNGWYQLEAGKRDVARAAFERALSSGSPPDTDWAFWALNGLGDILMQQGDQPGALKKYQDGLAFAEKLAKADPGNDDWRRDLSVSFQRIGNLQYAQGDLPGARKSFEDGLAIANRLAESDPANAGWQRDLSTYFGNIGTVQVAQGDLSAAFKSYEQGLAISEKLTNSDAVSPVWQRDLSAYFNNIGRVRFAQGDLPGALKSYRDAFAITDKLAKSDPGNAARQLDLWLCLNNIGSAQVSQRDLPAALSSYRDGIAIVDKLAKSDPGDTVWQRGLSTSYNNIGDTLIAQGDVAGALKSYRDGLAVTDRLTKSDPGNTVWQHDLSTSFINIGSALAAQGDIPGTLASYDKALPIMDELAKSEPVTAEKLHGVAMLFFKLAALLKQKNQSATALQASRQGRDVMARLVKRAPENAAWKRDLDLFDKQLSGFRR
jgi:tetratricopeptide (TPR) repeat protein